MPNISFRDLKTHINKKLDESIDEEMIYDLMVEEVKEAVIKITKEEIKKRVGS